MFSFVNNVKVFLSWRHGNIWANPPLWMFSQNHSGQLICCSYWNHSHVIALLKWSSIFQFLNTWTVVITWFYALSISLSFFHGELFKLGSSILSSKIWHFHNSPPSLFNSPCPSTIPCSLKHTQKWDRYCFCASCSFSDHFFIAMHIAENHGFSIPL